MNKSADVHIVSIAAHSVEIMKKLTVRYEKVKFRFSLCWTTLLFCVVTPIYCNDAFRLYHLIESPTLLYIYNIGWGPVWYLLLVPSHHTSIRYCCSPNIYFDTYILVIFLVYDIIYRRFINTFSFHVYMVVPVSFTTYR